MEMAQNPHGERSRPSIQTSEGSPVNRVSLVGKLGTLRCLKDGAKIGWSTEFPVGSGWAGV